MVDTLKTIYEFLFHEFPRHVKTKQFKNVNNNRKLLATTAVGLCWPIVQCKVCLLVNSKYIKTLKMNLLAGAGRRMSMVRMKDDGGELGIFQYKV